MVKHHVFPVVLDVLLRLEGPDKVIQPRPVEDHKVVVFEANVTRRGRRDEEAGPVDIWLWYFPDELA